MDTASGKPSELGSLSTSVPGNEKKSLFTRFVDLWWVDISRRLRPYSTLLWAAWSDGIYLTAWPRTATSLVVAVFLLGFVEGGTHSTFIGLNGYGLVSGVRAMSFAEMFPLLVLATLVGALSTNLGFMLVAGFALGDFFWFGVPYWPWSSDLSPWIPRTFYFRSSQIAAYLVFFLLAVWPLVATKFLVASAHRRLRESELWKTAVMTMLAALFVYEWTYFAPMGVKWQWTCCDVASQLDVRYFHTTTAPWLIAAAIIGVVARRLLILRAEKADPEVLSRLDAVCDPTVAPNSRMPAWLGAVIAALAITLLLLGYAGSLARGAMVFMIAVAILLLRTYFLPRLSLWNSWSTRAASYPAMARLIVASLLTYVACRSILAYPDFNARLRSTAQSFGPEIASILIGFVALLVLLPNGALSTEEEVPSGNPEMPEIPVPSAAVQAIIVIGVVLLASKKAWAAVCQDPACCFGGDNGLAGSAVAATTPSAASLPSWGGRDTRYHPKASRDTRYHPQDPNRDTRYHPQNPPAPPPQRDTRYHPPEPPPDYRDTRYHPQDPPTPPPYRDTRYHGQDQPAPPPYRDTRYHGPGSSSATSAGVRG